MEWNWLNEPFLLPYGVGLMPRKLAGPEKSTFENADIALHETRHPRQRDELHSRSRHSWSPELPGEETRAALNDLLVRVRWGRSRK